LVQQVIKYFLPAIGHPDFIYIRENQGHPGGYILRVLVHGVHFIARVVAGTREIGKKFFHFICCPELKPGD
jgi:hemolysin-activating ACP:hemolysin acyltransferase